MTTTSIRIVKKMVYLIKMIVYQINLVKAFNPKGNLKRIWVLGDAHRIVSFFRRKYGDHELLKGILDNFTL